MVKRLVSYVLALVIGLLVPLRLLERLFYDLVYKLKVISPLFPYTELTIDM